LKLSVDGLTAGHIITTPANPRRGRSHTTLWEASRENSRQCRSQICVSIRVHVH